MKPETRRALIQAKRALDLAMGSAGPKGILTDQIRLPLRQIESILADSDYAESPEKAEVNR